MIDPTTESLLSASDAAKDDSVPASTSTVMRWMMVGVAGGLKLESIKAGGRRFTSREALARFFDRTTNPNGEHGARSSVQRSRADRRAAAELEKLGV